MDVSSLIASLLELQDIVKAGSVVLVKVGDELIPLSGLGRTRHEELYLEVAYAPAKVDLKAAKPGNGALKGSRKPKEKRGK